MPVSRHPALPRRGANMSDLKQRVGRSGEDRAAEYLRGRGYRILHRNYRTRQAEIDIIAQHRGAIVFVEVKARRSREYGHPKWAVTPAKQRKISKAALDYLKKQRLMDVRARFDVVTIQDMDAEPCIEVFANAFELAYP
jgi:putative endonuclease